MDIFEFDAVKAEKTNAMLSYNRLRRVATLFRLFELCLVLFVISWTSTRLPFAVRLSGEYLRRLLSVIASPNFIFLLSNVIVVALVAKSGLFSAKSPTIDDPETDLYDEFVKNSVVNSVDFGPEISSTAPESEEIVYQDKLIISEVNIAWTASDSSEIATTASPISISKSKSDSKTYRRCQSENLERESLEKPCEKLRRSETEKFMKIVSSDDGGLGQTEEERLVVEKLSNEEFQRTIEAFIAKQVKFHQEEKVSVVPHSHTHTHTHTHTQSS